MRCKAWAAAVLLAVAAPAAGCGSSNDSDPKDEITSVVTDYYVSLAKRDGEKACSLLTSSGQGRKAQGGSCEQAVAEGGPNAMPRSLAPYDVEVVDIQIDGDSARAGARVVLGDGPEDSALESVTLRRDDDRWLLDETVR
jgi:hypothetical protein